MGTGWLTCISQVLRPHSLCRCATVNAHANRQMPIASVVRGSSKKKKMKLFDFIKRKRQTDYSPEQTMRRLVEYMPEFYKTHRQFVNSIDFLKQKEWELALNSLIELADETEHYFSEEFWVELAKSADKMNLNSQGVFCRQQIERNEKEINMKTPFGWTTIKIDDSHFQHYIAEKLKEEWVDDRREKDKVFELIKTDGIHLKSHGRTGYLYIVEKGKICEVEFELGTNGLILYFGKLTDWSLPTKKTLSIQEKQNIKNSITDWASKTKNEIEFDD